ncbi:MaoC family dehydratase N-terminal domain-containing protein [Micromonospora sp. BRA006-A]|nr:MaoC family dehydratase N-terminal domain-containing protein [Micromonospora sp. BRA006-A]
MSGPDTDGGTGTHRRFPVDGPYLVGREQVRVFAAALGERDPVCHDLTAARRRGFPDLVAPPSSPPCSRCRRTCWCWAGWRPPWIRTTWCTRVRTSVTTGRSWPVTCCASWYG